MFNYRLFPCKSLHVLCQVSSRQRFDVRQRRNVDGPTHVQLEIADASSEVVGDVDGNRDAHACLKKFKDIKLLFLEICLNKLELTCFKNNASVVKSKVKDKEKFLNFKTKLLASTNIYLSFFVTKLKIVYKEFKKLCLKHIVYVYAPG